MQGLSDTEDISHSSNSQMAHKRRNGPKIDNVNTISFEGKLPQYTDQHKMNQTAYPGGLHHHNQRNEFPQQNMFTDDGHNYTFKRQDSGSFRTPYKQPNTRDTR